MLALPHIQPDVKRPNLEYFPADRTFSASSASLVPCPPTDYMILVIMMCGPIFLTPSFVEQIYEYITGLYTAIYSCLIMSTYVPLQIRSTFTGDMNPNCSQMFFLSLNGMRRSVSFVLLSVTPAGEFNLTSCPSEAKARNE